VAQPVSNCNLAGSLRIHWAPVHGSADVPSACALIILKMCLNYIAQSVDAAGAFFKEYASLAQTGSWTIGGSADLYLLSSGEQSVDVVWVEMVSESVQAERNRWACLGDLNRRICCLSRSSGLMEFSASIVQSLMFSVHFWRIWFLAASGWFYLSLTLLWNALLFEQFNGKKALLVSRAVVASKCPTRCLNHCPPLRNIAVLLIV